MRASLRQFLTGLIDYAGLFPPAELDLETAMSNYAQYLDSEDRWMLGPFIVPEGRFHSAVELVPNHIELCRYSVLLKTDSGSAWAPLLAEQLQRITDTLSRSRNVGVAAFELRIPAEAADDEKRATEWLAFLEAGTREWNVPIFVEAERNEDWEAGWRRVIQALSNIREPGQEIARFGFKVRCGGVAPAAFPSVEQIAHALRWTADANVAIKATAGLHHPLRHHHEPLDVAMHGFVNVFSAALFSRQGLSIDTLTQILAETDPNAFDFDDAALRWQNETIPTEGIRATRPDVVSSFGSCSFDEPREDLRALGWL